MNVQTRTPLRAPSRDAKILAVEEIQVGDSFWGVCASTCSIFEI